MKLKHLDLHRHPHIAAALDAFVPGFIAKVDGDRVPEILIFRHRVELRDCAWLVRTDGDGRHKHTAATAYQKLRGMMGEHVALEMLLVSDPDDQRAVRIRNDPRTMLSAKRALARAHFDLPRIKVALESELNIAAMAAAYVPQIHAPSRWP